MRGRLTALAVGIALLLVGAVGVVRALGPTTTADGAPGGTAAGEGLVGVPGGLQVSQHGYSLQLPAPTAPLGRSVLSVTVLGSDGSPLKNYRATAGQEMHLILVQRDLSGYQHLHPTRDAAGIWRTPVYLQSGVYRVFAHFQPAGENEGLELGADLIVSGSIRPGLLPEPSRAVMVDGYEVVLDGDLGPGEVSPLRLTVLRNGVPVRDLQPVSEAYGHLVALRAGDLAFLRVHPRGGPHDRGVATGPEIGFSVEVPSAGTYRLYFEFKHRDVVRTAELTAVAGGA